MVWFKISGAEQLITRDRRVTLPRCIICSNNLDARYARLLFRSTEHFILTFKFLCSPFSTIFLLSVSSNKFNKRKGVNVCVIKLDVPEKGKFAFESHKTITFGSILSLFVNNIMMCYYQIILVFIIVTVYYYCHYYILHLFHYCFVIRFYLFIYFI